jgi:hypothetical protein
MMSLRLDDRGLECRQINVDTAPSKVASLLATIREIGNGLDILPDTAKAAILQSSHLKDENTRIWRYAFKEPGVLDTLPGHISTPEEIALICDHARKCHDKSHEEAAWNMEVHHRLLQAVFRQPGSCESDFLNFTTLQALGRRTPTLTVNHTDFMPLQLTPIALSIETKRPGKELDAAQLQMGVWHAAQWMFLLSVVGLTPQAASVAEELSRRRLEEEALAEQGFIPGIIVHGHRWLFVFSTLEGKKTVLWTERQIGTTQSILDSYQVVAGLREIAGWARDVYLPWYRSKVPSRFEFDVDTI